MKPNHDRVAGEFDKELISDQLKYNGIVDMAHIRNHGKNCELILKKLDISEYQIGKSKVSPLVTTNICSQLSPPVHILLCWSDWLMGKCQLRVNTARIVKIA